MAAFKWTVCSFIRSSGKCRGPCANRTRHNSYRDWKSRCGQLVFWTCPISLLYPLEGLYLIGLPAIDSTHLCRRLDSLLGRLTFGMCRLCWQKGSSTASPAKPPYRRQILGNSLCKSSQLKHSELTAGAPNCVTHGQAASYGETRPQCRSPRIRECVCTYRTARYWITFAENHRQLLLQINHPLAVPHARELTVDGSTTTQLRNRWLRAHRPAARATHRDSRSPGRHLRRPATSSPTIGKALFSQCLPVP